LQRKAPQFSFSFLCLKALCAQTRTKIFFERGALQYFQKISWFVNAPIAKRVNTLVRFCLASPLIFFGMISLSIRSNWRTMQYTGNAWDKDALKNPETEYQTLLSLLRNKQDFGMLFVRCSPAEGEQIIKRIRVDAESQTIRVLRLDRPIADVC
jgi:hypothetical protein